MIIKFIDIYLETKLSSENAKHYVEKNLEEHVREISDFDLEHFVEKLEDTGKFESVEIGDEDDFEIEYTQNEVETFVDGITDEMFDEDDDDDDDDDFDEDEDDEDGSGWD